MIFSSVGSCSVKSSSSHVIFGAYSFRVLEAEIHESLSSLFKIICHCYYEGFTNAPFGEESSCFLLGGDVLFCLNSPDRSRLDDKKLSVSDIKIGQSVASFSPEKVFRGIISEFSYDGNSYSDGSSCSSDVKSLKRRHYYHFTITSPLYKLSLNQCYRIFTSVSVPDVLKSVLERYTGFLNKEYDFSNIFNSYPPSEYISQYNESDLCFLERLCLNNGIYFYEDEEKVYFYDSIYHTCSNKGSSDGVSGVRLSSYPFNSNPNNNLNYRCVYGIEKGYSLQPLSALSSSVNPCLPLEGVSETSVDYFSDYDESNDGNNEDERSLHTVHSHYHSPSFSDQTYFSNHLKLSSNLSFLSGLFRNMRFHAKSNIPVLRLNDILELEDFDGSSYFGNRSTKGERYKITGIVHYFEDKSESVSVLGKTDSGSSYYFNRLTLVPKNIPFVGSPVSKPLVYGCILGVVIGEREGIEDERNTIYTDDYGRIKVRFGYNVTQSEIDSPSTSDKRFDYSHTCFLRCLTPISGYGSGFVAIPRVGDEVLIGFLEGDCDKPVVMGSLYNDYNVSLLQDDIKTSYHRTSLSSRTVGKDQFGLNEITLSNLPKEECIYVHAEKDYEEEIKNNFTQTIDMNKQSTVKGGYIENIAMAHMQNIGLGKSVNVVAEYVTVVGASKDTAVGLSNTLNVGVSNIVNVAKDSAENIGGSKNESIGLDLTTIIGGEEKKTVAKNVEETVTGSIDQTSNSGINITSNKHYTLNSKDDTELFSDANITLKSKDNTSFQSGSMDIKTDDGMTMNIGKECDIEIKKKMSLKIGDAEITSDGNKIILKVGSVELTLDSQGLKLKSGKLSVE